jgi:hypothetical protein
MPGENDIAQVVSAWLAASAESPEPGRQVVAAEGTASPRLQLNFLGKDGANHALHLAASMRDGKPVIVANIGRYPNSTNVTDSLPELQRISAWFASEEARAEAEMQLLRTPRRSNN